MPSLRDAAEWVIKRISALTRTATDANLTDSEYMAVDDASAYTRKITVASLATWILGKIKSLATSITAFRTGDVIPVDGPSGPAKMSKDNLLLETAENALGSIHSLSDTATEADFVAGNFLAIDVPGVGGATKKVPGNLVAPKSVQDMLVETLGFSVTELSSGYYVINNYLEYVNRSLKSSTGEVSDTENLKRASTPLQMQMKRSFTPFVLKADSGYQFILHAWSNASTHLGSTDWLTEISRDEIVANFSSATLFRIVVKADDESDIDLSTFDGVKYIFKASESLATMAMDELRQRVVQGIGFTNQSLRAADGSLYGYNSKRLLSDFIPIDTLSKISPFPNFYYNTYFYDKNKTFIASWNSWQDIPRTISGCKTSLSATGAFYVRIYLKKTDGVDDLDISVNDAKFVYLTTKDTSVDAIPFEQGSLDLRDGGFLKSSTTSDSDNATGFNGKWRSGKFIKATFGSATFYFDDAVVTDLVLLEYDKYFKLTGEKTISAETAVEFALSTCYIKLFASSTDCPDVKMLYKGVRLEFVCNSDTAYVEHSYIYQVPGNCGLDIMEDGSADTQYANNVYYYNSLTFKLPPNYSAEGSPVPVIFFCHGSHAMESRTDVSMSPDSGDYTPFLDYLNAEGFAVLDCCSQSSKWPNTGRLLHNSNPDDMACIASAIKWFTENYNVQKFVYVAAKSRGGNAGLAMCYSSAYRVKACGLLAPSISCFSKQHIFSYDSIVRKRFAEDVGCVDVGDITADSLEYSPEASPTANAKAYVNGNSEKLINQCSSFVGFPGSVVSDMVAALVNFNYDDTLFETTPREISVPAKIWIAPDDTQVSYNEALKWQTTIKLGRGVACIRTMPSGTGGHHAVDTDENALTVASIVTRLGVTKTDVPLAYVELVRWFRQFE